MDLQAILPEARIREMTEAGLWPDKLVLDYLDDAVAGGPDRPAIVGYNSETGETTTLSYAEFDRLSRKVALALIGLGVEVGEVVSCQLPNWWQFTVLHVACVRIGAISNPLMPIFRERELSFMLGLAEAKVLVAPASFRGFDYRAMVADLRADLPALDHAFFIGGDGDDAFEGTFLAGDDVPADAASAIFADRRPGPNDVTEIIYTSGTTGEPKGAMHTANTLFGCLGPFHKWLPMTADDVFLMASPMAHQTGFLYGMLAPIMLGARSVLQDLWNPRRAIEIIRDNRATFTMASTPFLNDLAGQGEPGSDDVASLRTFLSAGAPVPPALVERAQQRLDVQVLSGWGMTEVGLATCCRPGDPPEKIFATDGHVMEGSDVQVVDAGGAVVPVGVEGFLKTRGSAMFVGYLKRPNLYSLDDDGWFDTGDLARMDADGYIRISGRSKDIIIRGGENIPVVEVEAVLFRHPAVQDVAIVGVPDQRLGERGCAYVQCKPGASLDFGEMIDHLAAENMARQYLPEFLEIVDEFPRTPSGKIQKFVLRERAKTLAR